MGPLRSGNLVLLPYWPLSLGSTVQVRRALEDLRLRSGKDVLCVPYPVSLRIEYEKALAGLPEGPTAIAPMDKRLQRALIPVFVNEPPVEASRFADERGIERRMIGGLFRMETEEEERYPLRVEDALVAEIGAAAWLKAVSGQFREARYDVRDRYDLGLVKELCGSHERVIMLSHAQDIRALEPWLSRLREGIVPTFSERGVAAVSLWSTTRPDDTDAHAHYMAPFPGLCEAYERARAAGKAAHFDPVIGISRVVAEVASNAFDMRFSIEAHTRFQLLLDRSIARDSDFPSNLDGIVDLTASVFNPPFARRLRHKLTSYFEKRPTGSVGTIPRDARTFDNVAWPGHKALVSGILRAIHQRVNERPLPEDAVVPFRGAMKGGVAVRRTLRAAFAGDDRIFVKEQSSRMETIDPLEPVLFLFDPGIDPKEGEFTSTWCGKQLGEPQLTALWQFCSREKDERLNVGDFSFLLHRSFGYVAFCDPLLHLDRLRERYPDPKELLARVPLKRGQDEKLRTLERSVLDGRLGWMEALLHGALHFAKRAVIVVPVDDVPVPAWAGTLARDRSKQLVIMRDKCMNGDDERRMRFGDISITGTHPRAPDDRNDVRYLLGLEDRFREVMATVW